MNNNDTCLMSAAMRAAIDLIASYELHLSESAMKIRMRCISEELIQAINYCEVDTLTEEMDKFTSKMAYEAY